MRLHPYDLAFGRDAMDDRLFPPIAQEAAARDLPLYDPDRFLFLGSVGHLLRAVAGGAPADKSIEAAARGTDEAGEELQQHGRLLFHAFHYWRAGRQTLAVDETALRRLLVAPANLAGWRLRVPAPAGYIQIPRNLLWAAPSPGMPPEPADGFFWTLPKENLAPLHILLVLGVREDRPGFSVIPATGVLDPEMHWADVDARPGGTDFETTIPGGEIDRLHSIETPAEMLKLASLCFWHVDPAAEK